MNQVHIKYFGVIADETGKKEEFLPKPNSINAFMDWIKSTYPGLSNYTFRLALNERIIDANEPLKPGDVIALLPPFSGG